VASIVEVRAETDFTAKNEQFVNMVGKVAVSSRWRTGPHAGAIACLTPEIKAEIDNVRIKTGENCSYARGLQVRPARRARRSSASTCTTTARPAP
jgi:translation elongation factor EF-Ts